MKLKRKSVTLVSLIVALLCAAFGIQSTRGIALSTRTVGVQIGQWAEYNAFVDGNATGFNKTNTPVSIRITFVGISGTNVTCQNLETFMNATQKTLTGIVDVDSGSGNMTMFLIAANLNVGDLIYNGTWSWTGATINETTTRNYLGSNVETNHMNLTRQSTGPLNYSMSYNFFWFRDSGMLAEAVINMTESGSGFNQWAYEHVTITGTNVPEFPVSMILPLFAVISTLAVVSAKKRLVKK